MSQYLCFIILEKDNHYYKANKSELLLHFVCVQHYLYSILLADESSDWIQNFAALAEFQVKATITFTQ